MERTIFANMYHQTEFVDDHKEGDIIKCVTSVNKDFVAFRKWYSTVSNLKVPLTTTSMFLRVT